MATRPAAQHISLDTLIARARPAARPASTPKPLRPAPRPLADLERASSIANAPPQPATTPIALALWITVRRCACGSVTRCPPDYVLVKYEANAHSVHYHRSDLRAFAHLPREIREKEVNIAVCEACFDSELRSNLPASEDGL